MATKRVAKKIIPIQEIKVEPKILPAEKEVKIKKCKTGCDRKARIVGFCGICYTKYLKGYFLKTGKKHPDILEKEKQQKLAKQKKAIKKEANNRKRDKEELKKVFTKDLLKILQTVEPSTAATKPCPHLDFWTSDAICYNRLFIINRRECENCKDHDHSVPHLLEFIKEHTDGTTPTTTITSTRPVAETNKGANTTAGKASK